MELLPYFCFSSLFNQYCLRLSRFLLLKKKKKGVISLFFHFFCAGSSTRVRSKCKWNCANRPASLVPAIILLLTMSPFTISFLQCLVQLTRIMTPCIWTFHTFYHFCLSNGHQNLSLLQFVSDWHFQSIKLGTIGTILTNIRLCYYWAVPSWSRNLPLSFLNSLRPDVQTLKTELIHFPCLLQYWNDHFKNNSTDLSPQFFPAFIFSCFLLFWESVIYFASQME